MKDTDTVNAAPAVIASRRAFMGRGLVLLIASIAPGCKAEPMPPSAEPLPLWSRSRGAARISVRDTGARGDGVHDDTAAFQRAIDALTDAGGTVEVPAGRYLIDAERSVRLRSRMHLQLADDAVLVAKPNDVERAYVLYVHRAEDVEISGGRIAGERHAHRGTTGEWGMGIQILGGSRVTVRDMRIADCWGDGIYTGAAGPPARKAYGQDIVVARVACIGNRRQGLSIGGCNDVQVVDSEFSDTHGTSPQCGIDIEPGKGEWARRVQIRSCRLRRNAAYGINVFERAHDVAIEDCTIEDNRSCGVVTVGASDVKIIGNTIRNNGSTGVFIKQGSTGVVVRDNIFRNNYARQTPPPREDFSMAGTARKIRREVLVSEAASDVRVAVNHYR